jgi:hypothetical protein
MMDNLPLQYARGGFSGKPVANGANVSKGIGMLLVRAVERASLYAPWWFVIQRQYGGAEPCSIFREDWLHSGPDCGAHACYFVK